MRSGDWPAACHIGRSAALPANHHCVVGLLPLPRQEFRQLKLILHSELRRRAASRRALPCPSSPICNMSMRSGDIRDQSRRLYKIDRNFACFWPPDFFGGGPPNFWTCIILSSQFPTMWPSFRAIGRGTSENAWRKNKERKKKNITSIL